MRTQVARALTAAGIALAVFAATALPAAAATSGSETVRGIIVASGVSGTRTTVASVAIAKGVFRGVGRIVAVPPQPGDPANVSRVDLVYRVGAMHLVSTTVGASSTVDPLTCLFRAALQQQSQITGGTGLFVHAAGTFTGTIRPMGLLPRNADGSCAAGQPVLHEVDRVAFSGTLSF
jgi:hypothetical protein